MYMFESGHIVRLQEAGWSFCHTVHHNGHAHVTAEHTVGTRRTDGLSDFDSSTFTRSCNQWPCPLEVLMPMPTMFVLVLLPASRACHGHTMCGIILATLTTPPTLQNLHEHEQIFKLYGMDYQRTHLQCHSVSGKMCSQTWWPDVLRGLQPDTKLAILSREVKKAYKAMIGSIIEYAAVVYDPYVEKEAFELEKVRRNAVRWGRDKWGRQRVTDMNESHEMSVHGTRDPVKIIKHNAYFGTTHTSAQRILQHNAYFSTMHTSAQHILQHNAYFSTMHTSAQCILQHNAYFSTTHTSAQ
ncbi:hypothetical protein PR048_020775 [Dryococelus australis]|uniref:Sperm-lysin n=1 Tax=Dryococelus australis TaxID=614101 RepID=A0ABQ9GWD0_9NEOP|nr:hypothetical protein PR048_020775 [Dryococelus australis]